MSMSSPHSLILRMSTKDSSDAYAFRDLQDSFFFPPESLSESGYSRSLRFLFLKLFLKRILSGGVPEQRFVVLRGELTEIFSEILVHILCSLE